MHSSSDMLHVPKFNSIELLKMEASRPKTPTVIPLPKNVVEQLMKQQQKLLPGEAQRSAQRLLVAQRQAPRTGAAAQSGAGPQTATILSPQCGATALIGSGDQGQGPGSRTAISVQVLNNTSSNHTQSSSVSHQSVPILYTYKVKIINPNKKSVSIVRYLHNVTSKFESVSGLRVRLMDEFEEHVPSTATFDVGYFEGKQQSKIWLVTSEDLKKLYELHPKGGEVLLWCDGASEGTTEGRSLTKRNKEAESAVLKRSQQETEVESVYKELKERHQDSWDTPRLKLWARCIVSGIHDDYDNPPESPAFFQVLLPKDHERNLWARLLEELV